jgi:RsiW-degrading membrane proteinase PrsW (M82 family)
MNKKQTTGFFAYSPWDILPAIAGVLNAAFVVLFYLAFAYWHAPWWVLICMGFTFSVSIGWNINSVSHNFVHVGTWVLAGRLRCGAHAASSRQ